MMKNKKFQIGVIGSAGDEEYPKSDKQRQKLFLLAEEVGRLLGEKGITLITGGKGGIMLAAAKGAKKSGGLTVGFVKGKERLTSNPYIDVEVVSGMLGCGEETMLVLSSDGLIALGGGAGTLQELTVAYRNKKPVIILDTGFGWSSKVADIYLDERKIEKFYRTKTSKQAVTLLLKLLKWYD